ncbi:hypothetical protein B0H13DRAFT_1978302 [Mycena leptocephala]|nr:hypothetical protein B0H13DRAFT_1978302 [Mycena leptocephala]
MADTKSRPYKPYPWPWEQASILSTTEEERPQGNWLDADLGDDEDALNSEEEYVPPEGSGSEEDESSGDSDEEMSDSDGHMSNGDISESELAYIIADAQTGWPSSPTPSLKELEEQEELTRQIADLVKAEQDAAAAYNPDEVVSLITQLYELLVNMGHWPEGSIHYPPHTNPPVNEELAVQLGYVPAAISLMNRLPYLTSRVNEHDSEIVSRTRFADYTREEDLREGRSPYPYQYMDGCPPIDPWLLPLMLPNRDGWHVMLDTNLGVVRAYSTERTPPQNTVEWRRHGKVSDAEFDQATWTEYRRAPLVPAAHYFSELIYAYRSLSRLPVILPERNDPKETRYPIYPAWLANQEREEQNTLLALYRECGWPDEWRRAEFMTKWKTQKREIDTRARQAMIKNDSSDKRRR